MNSPLVRQISLVVFLCIVAVEAMLLLVTFADEKERLLQRIDYSLQLVFPIYESTPSFDMFDVLVSGGHDEIRYPIEGLVVRLGSGIEYHAGDTEGLQENDYSMVRADRFHSDTRYYDVFIGAHEDEGRHTKAWFRVDGTQVAADLRGFVLRSLMIMLVSSLFVTFGCVLALTPILLQPLVDLQKQMSGTRKNGLRSYTAPKSALRRRDELGGTYREFDWLHHALLDAETSNQTINNRFQDFADLGADCFWELDRAQRLVFITGDSQGLFGLCAEEIVGLRLDDLVRREDFPFSNPGDLLCSLLTDNQWEGALHFAAEPQLERTVRIVSTPIFRADGSLIGMRGTAANTTVASKMARDLNHLANRDALTGLFNRRRFDELLQDSIDRYRQRDEVFCVGLLDLDRFKVVNDNSGHAAGDALLKELANIICKHVASDDVVSRYGGDEFTVILKNCNIERGLEVCERIRYAISHHCFNWENVTYDVGVSIGIVEVNAELAHVSDILSSADACCYNAKHLGRDQVQTVTSEEISQEAQSKDSYWVELIAKNLESDKLKLYFQPMTSTSASGTISQHLDIALALDAGEGQHYQRNSYAATAERYGFISHLDRWMLDAAIHQVAALQVPDESDFLVYLGLADSSVTDTTVQQCIERAVVESEVNAKQICFVISESLVLRGGAPVNDFMRELQALGCLVAVKGFCAGLSSLAFAKRLPVDIFLIDAKFATKTDLNPIESAVLKSMVEVSKLLGIRTVVMNVDSDEILSSLADLGVEMVQGGVSLEPAVWDSSKNLLLPSAVQGRLAG
mgnify:CR=1 FL=1